MGRANFWGAGGDDQLSWIDLLKKLRKQSTFSGGKIYHVFYFQTCSKVAVYKTLKKPDI
jgi:hypothetical protein